MKFLAAKIVLYVLVSVSDGYQPRLRMGAKEKAEARAQSVIRC